MTGERAGADSVMSVIGAQVAPTILRCGCAHAEELHPAGPCTVTLPAFLEDELPAWNCPCRQFTAAAVPGWRWHAATSTWQLVSPPEEESAA